jgi:hypothetical protein
MTVEERIARLEVKDYERDKKLDKIEAKVDRLVSAADMGKGAFWVALKLGGWLLALGSIGKVIYDAWPHK